MMGWYGGGGMGAGIWVFMILIWLVLIGAVVLLSVAIAKLGRNAPTTHSAGPWNAAPGGPPPAPPQGPSPLEVLDHRLANGEIDLATYQQTRAALLESRGGR